MYIEHSDSIWITRAAFVGSTIPGLHVVDIDDAIQSVLGHGFRY